MDDPKNAGQYDLGNSNITTPNNEKNATGQYGLPADHPMHWSRLRKHLILVQVALQAAGAGFTSAIIIPGIEPIAEQFNITPHKATYLIGIHVLFLGLGPFLWSPLMNSLGRRPVLMSSMLLSTVAALGGGFANGFGTLMTARVFQSIGISAGFVVAGAVVVDLFSAEERGRKNGWWTQTIVIGPGVGALIGGPLIEHENWRWALWLIAILNGIQTIFYFFTSPETSYPHRKQQSLPSNPTLHELFHPPTPIPNNLTPKSFAAPFLFIQAPHVLLIALAYGVAFAIASPGISIIIPIAFSKFYAFGPIPQGLSFTAVLIGVILGEQIAGKLSDHAMTRERIQAKRQGRDVKLEKRLWTAVPGYFMTPVGLIVFGVTLQCRTHWIGPVVGLGVASFGLQLVTTPLKTYCVDCYPLHAGAVMQLINFTRQIVAFTVPFWNPVLNEGVGYALGFGVEAIIVIAFFILSLVVFWKGTAMRETVVVRWI